MDDPKIASYGLAIYYKFYTASNPTVLFENDMAGIQSHGSENQQTIMNNYGFRPVTVETRPRATAADLPTIGSLATSWALTFKGPTNVGGQAQIGIGVGTAATGFTVLRRNVFRNVSDTQGLQFPDATDVYKAGDLDIDNASANPAISPSAASIYVGFVAFMYGFSFDFGTIVFSSTVSLGEYQVR